MNKIKSLIGIMMFLMVLMISGCSANEEEVAEPTFFGLGADDTYTVLVEYYYYPYDSNITMTIKYGKEYLYVDYFREEDGMNSYYEYYLNLATDEKTVIKENRITDAAIRDFIEPYLYDLRLWNEEMFKDTGIKTDFAGNRHEYMMKEEAFSYVPIENIRDVWLDQTEDGIKLDVYYYYSSMLVHYNMEIYDIGSTVVELP